MVASVLHQNTLETTEANSGVCVDALDAQFVIRHRRERSDHFRSDHVSATDGGAVCLLHSGAPRVEGRSADRASIRIEHFHFDSKKPPRRDEIISPRAALFVLKDGD